MNLKELINRDFSEDCFKRCNETHICPDKFLTAFVKSSMGGCECQRSLRRTRAIASKSA